ncbi:MAG TPA: hypothetical protein DDW17_08805 [Deltaproteobacteria bacterium]|nr:hypothetical protein [Deltaproteobacteria bacterium]
MKRAFLILIIIYTVTCIITQGTTASELSREEALTLIKGSLMQTKDSDFIKTYTRQGLFYSIGSDKETIARYSILEQQGYVKINPPPDSKEKGQSLTTCGIQFTEKASPYISQPEKNSEHKAFVTLAKVDSLDVIGLRRLNEKEFKAEVALGYRLTPFGEILLGHGVILQRKEDAYFEAQDNGWRIKFKINF